MNIAQSIMRLSDMHTERIFILFFDVTKFFLDHDSCQTHDAF